MPLLEIKLHSLGPWRTGYAAGDRERVDAVFHSDAVYSAITFAMRQLGWLDEWLAATAPGGRLVYSVCTISRAEGEEVVADFVGQNPEFELESSRQLLPHQHGTDGFFIAALRRA